MAEAAVQKANDWVKRQGGTRWGDVVEHPAAFRYAVPFENNLRGAFGTELPGQLASESQATALGFYFSPLNGRFYKPLHQCQSAETLVDALAETYGQLPFPVSRTLFHGALAFFYAVRENTRYIVTGEVAQSLPRFPDLRRWWNERTNEMYAQGELLHFLHGLHNSAKHGDASVPTHLRPMARYLDASGRTILASGCQYMADAMGTRFGSEGVFEAKPFAPGYERWCAHSNPSWVTNSGFRNAEFAFEIAGLPSTHVGLPIERRDPVSVASIALEYHYELVRGAINAWAAASQKSEAPPMKR